MKIEKNISKKLSKLVSGAEKHNHSHQEKEVAAIVINDQTFILKMALTREAEKEAPETKKPFFLDEMFKVAKALDNIKIRTRDNNFIPGHPEFNIGKSEEKTGLREPEFKIDVNPKTKIPINEAIKMVGQIKFNPNNAEPSDNVRSIFLNGKELQHVRNIVFEGASRSGKQNMAFNSILDEMTKYIKKQENDIQRPPHGLTPQYLFLEQRLQAIQEAKERYRAAKFIIPKQWIQEEKEIMENFFGGSIKKPNNPEVNETIPGVLSSKQAVENIMDFSKNFKKVDDHFTDAITMSIENLIDRRNERKKSAIDHKKFTLYNALREQKNRMDEIKKMLVTGSILKSQQNLCERIVEKITAATIDLDRAIEAALDEKVIN